MDHGQIDRNSPENSMDECNHTKNDEKSASKSITKILQGRLLCCQGKRNGKALRNETFLKFSKTTNAQIRNASMQQLPSLEPLVSSCYKLIKQEYV